MGKKSVSDKILTALLVASLAGITLIILPMVFSMAGFGEPLYLYLWLFSWVGALVLLGFAIAGYLMSDENIESIFSFLWGTHNIYSNQRFQLLTIAVIVILVVKFNL